RLQRPIVLPEIPPSRGEPVGRAAFFRTLGPGHARRLTDQMDDLAVGHIPARPTRPGGTQAKIGLLEVHEVAFVEQADFLEYLPPDHHARATHPIDLHQLVRW